MFVFYYLTLRLPLLRGEGEPDVEKLIFPLFPLSYQERG
jgi:hypothetical protein